LSKAKRQKYLWGWKSLLQSGQQRLLARRQNNATKRGCWLLNSPGNNVQHSWESTTIRISWSLPQGILA
jgi:hypothetical protein